MRAADLRRSTMRKELHYSEIVKTRDFLMKLNANGKTEPSMADADADNGSSAFSGGEVEEPIKQSPTTALH